MTWTRLSDDFNDRADLARPGRSARLLHIEALVWCNKVLTDGALPDHMVRRFTDSDDVDRDVAELADAGLWTRLEAGDGWQVDWSGQESAEEVEQRREDHNARQRRYNERQRLHARDDHSKCHPSHCPALRRNASHDASRNASDDAYPTRPVPSRPIGRDGSEVREGGSASGDRAHASGAHGSSATPPGGPGWGPPPDVTPTVNGVPIKPMTADEADR